MANLFDCTTNSSAFQKLQNLKTELIKEQEIAQKKAEEERIESHKKHHIFSGYEDALDYLKQNPGSYIRWHCRDITYNTSKELFKSYEQDYSFDGVMCYDVVRHYTKEQLLEQIEEHKKYMKETYPDDDLTNHWFDEFGKLEYVHLLN